MAETNSTAAPYGVAEKACIRCGVLKPATSDSFNSNGGGRLKSVCKVCASNEWKAKHREKAKDRPQKHIGDRYGRLTVIEKIGVGSRDSPVKYKLACDCGGEVEAPIGRVRFGSVLSCGCMRRELASSRKTVDMTGERVGRLLILCRAGVTRFGAVTWKCICDCGVVKEIPGQQLRHKRNPTRSCGCLHKEAASENCKKRKKANPVSRTKEYKSALKKRRRGNPTVAMAERMSRMLALALQKVGELKESSTFAMLGYTPEDLRSHIERQFLRGMSWENRDRWQIDHIIPISLAKSAEDVIALNQLPNLRPLWSEDNNHKKDKRVLLL